MPEYYLDIETNAKGTKPDVENDEILTIQFQRLGMTSGRKQGELTILKSWESSEEDILERFYSIYHPYEPFIFIPIGLNLKFEFFTLYNRWNKFGFDISLKNLIYDHPYIDIRTILVILNGGSFSGATLNKFTGKTQTGDMIPRWYANKDYSSIEKYIIDEAEEFIKLYQRMKEKIPIAMKYDDNINDNDLLNF